MVVAQLVERSLPTPEIRGSNPNIGKLYIPIVHWNWKDENKEKEARIGPLKKRSIIHLAAKVETKIKARVIVKAFIFIFQMDNSTLLKAGLKILIGCQLQMRMI